jgi:hypothetical protein
MLLLVEQECEPEDRKIAYTRVIVSQLTVYEVSYLFYVALANPHLLLLRQRLIASSEFLQRVGSLSIPKAHRDCFARLWKIDVPRKRHKLWSPLDPAETKKARTAIRAQRRRSSK